MMALLQMGYFSEALRKRVNVNALIPFDTMQRYGHSSAKIPLKTLYLLHGYRGHYEDWLSYSRIRELSDRHCIAVIMPSGDNFFYVDDIDMGIHYGEYIGNELVSFTRMMFPLSERREDTFIGGLSMGGYGAVRNGLKYSGNFSKIFALSSALITYKVAGITEDYKDNIADYHFYKRIFGNPDQIMGSDKDPEALLLNLKKEGKEIPEIYLACGTEDSLLDFNRRFRDFMVSEKIAHTYVEGPGEHDWDFWNTYIEKAANLIGD